MTPTVSILTAVYNGAHYLPDTITSVLAQDMPDWELIISDNVSTDETADVAQRYAQEDDRIKYFRNETHVSAVENFNLCYRRSDPQSTYIALLASDDWWEPTFLSQLTAIGKQYPSVAFIHSDMYRTDPDGKIVNRYADLFKRNPDPGLHQAVEELFEGVYINIMAALINRKVLNEIYPVDDLLDPELKLTPDFNLWLQLLIRGAYGYYIPEPLAYYRKHDAAMTMRARNIPRLYEEITIFKEKIREACPPELEELRQHALEQRLVPLALELLYTYRIQEAIPLLHDIHHLHPHRMDTTIARFIATLPLPVMHRTVLWRVTLSIAKKLGKVH